MFFKKEKKEIVPTPKDTCEMCPECGCDFYNGICPCGYTQTNLYRYVNLTPHTINITGERPKPSEGICRVSSTHRQVGSDPATYVVEYGELEGLPEPEEGKIYIVSLIALNVAKANGRTDCVAPASGHPDVIRDKGQIVSVPGYVR